MFDSRSARMCGAGLCAIALMVCALFAPTWAGDFSLMQVESSTMSYGGFLSDALGDPVADGNYSMVFRLLVNQGDPSELWMETRTVTVQGGRFVVNLGEVSPLADSILDSANFIEVSVNGETLSPATKLSYTPASFTSNVSKSMRGDMITGVGFAYIPENSSPTAPKVVELSKAAGGGQLAITGDGGGTWSTQVALAGGPSGGAMHVLGPDSTQGPLVSLVIDNGSGMMNLYPGSEWISGPDTAMRMSVGSDGGRLGIWGTESTAMPQLELLGTAAGGVLNLYPGSEWLAGPTEAMQMAVDSGGARLGIWGTDGTAIPQVELYSSSTAGGLNFYPGSEWLGGPDTAMRMSVDSDGGRLGIWGTESTAMPQLELLGTAAGGVLNLYPGSEWLAGPTEAMQMAVDSSGARLGIWGTNGTSIPQLKMSSTTAGGQLGIWGTDGTSIAQLSLGTTVDGGLLTVRGNTPAVLERVELDAGDGAGNLAIWGTNGTAFPRANLYGDFYGGTLVLRDSTSTAKIFLDGVTDGDGSVNLPASAINATEMLNEPGLAQDRATNCNTIDTTVMEDLATVTITIPADGYIFLTGSGMVEFSGTTSGNRVDVQIDETSGGAPTNGYFSRIGLAGYSSSSFSSFDFCVTRTYFKSAGTHTFILEGRKLYLTGTASICWPVLTAVYLPTSYGTVTTVASNKDWAGDERSAVSEGVYGTEEEVDLRTLELRAEQARAKAVEAELALAKARTGVK